MLETWSFRRGGRLREVFATGGSTVLRTGSLDKFMQFKSFHWLSHHVSHYTMLYNVQILVRFVYYA